MAAGDSSGFNAVIVPVLNRLARSAPADADHAIADALADLGRAAGFDRTYVFWLRDGVFLDNTHEWTAPGIAPMIGMLQGLPVDMVAYWRDDFDSDKAIFIPMVTDLALNRPERAILIEQEIQSILVVPMQDRGKWIGFVGYDAVREPRALFADHVLLLQSAANGIAALLLRRQTEQALRESRAQLAATMAALPDLVIELDAEGRFVARHADHALSPLGLSDLMIGDRIEDHVPAPIAEIFHALMADAEVSHRSATRIYDLALPGDHRWFEAAAAPRSPVGQACTAGFVFVIRDITDRKRAELALVAREELLSGLFTQSPIGIVLNDWLTGATIDVNPAFIAFSGRDRNDMSRTRVVDLLTPDQSGIGPASIAALRMAGRYGPLETTFRRPDGSPFPVSVSGVKAQDSQGHTFVWNFIVDLTEQRQQEAAIKARSREATEARQRFETALEAIPDAFVLYGADDRLVMFNKHYKDLYPELSDLIVPGTPRIDIIKEAIRLGLISAIDGTGQPSVEAILDRDRTSSSVSEQELHDGRILRVIEKRTPDGGRVGLRSDVTAARRADWRLANVVEGAQVGTWEWDVVTGANTVNKRWTDMLGYEPDDLGQMTNEIWRSLGHPDDVAATQQKLELVLDGTLDAFETEFRMRHKNGSWVWVQSRGSVVRRGEDGRPKAMAGVHLDISALKEAEARLEDIISGAKAGTWQSNVEKNENVVDARWAAMLGNTLAEVSPMTLSAFFDRIHPGDLELLQTRLRTEPETEDGHFEYEFRMRHRAGHWVWVQSRGRVVRRKPDGTAALLAGIHIDITQQKLREEALRAARDDLELALAERDSAKKRFFDVAEISSDWFWETDADLRFTFMSESFERSTGGTRIHIGRTLDELTRDDARTRQSADWQMLFAKFDAREPFRDFAFLSLGKADSDVWVRISGSPQFDKSGRFLGYRGVGSDITALYLAKNRAELLATRDPLTGLANRAVFQDRLRALSESPQTAGRGGAVMMLDLDHFKSINDSFGHDAGDALLQQVAQRLTDVIRHTDLIARLGGDEFTVLLPDAHAEEAMDVAWRMIEALSQPVDIMGQSLFISLSIGITLYPDHGQSAVDLLQNADIAMYRAKAAGRSQFALFKPELREEQTRRSDMMQAMRRGLREDRFRLAVQPKFDFSTPPRLVGAEALLRWNDPEFGEVTPGQFIPLAESTGLILEIDLMVVTLAARLLARWQTMGLTCPLAINMSAQSFQLQNIASEILSRLAAHGVAPACLQLEITETALMTRKDVTFRNIRRLEAEGVGVVIDDFGTGYSSLSYLQDLPLAELKIDQSFVRKLGHADTGAEAIVKAILAMAKALGMLSVAEGVETPDQCNWLRAQGCDIAQGFLFDRPSEIPDFEARYLGEPDHAIARAP